MDNHDLTQAEVEALRLLSTRENTPFPAPKSIAESLLQKKLVSVGFDYRRCSVFGLTDLGRAVVERLGAE